MDVDRTTTSKWEDEFVKICEEHNITNSPDFDPPLYNVWKQQTKTAGVNHFGNSEVRWLENLLYLYTNPADIVVDPFAGSGSTIDLCKKRKRRYPYANVFPLLAADELATLAADIRSQGLQQPIVLLNGQILDGRNRYLACEQAGVAPRFTDYTGDDPVGFVVSANLKRRHLNESQRAMVGATIKPLFEEQAKQRQLAAQNNNAAKAVRANLPEQEGTGRASEDAKPLTFVDYAELIWRKLAEPGATQQKNSG